MTPVSQSGPPSSGVRPRWPAFVLVLPFLASILGSWAWFNTDLGRSGVLVTPKPSEGGSALDSLARQSNLSRRNKVEADATAAQPRIWLTAFTNIPGCIFIEEPVSNELVRILGATRIRPDLIAMFHIRFIRLSLNRIVDGYGLGERNRRCMLST